jgi:hypothetical protein
MGGKEYGPGEYPDPYSYLKIEAKEDGTGNRIIGIESEGVVAIAREYYHDDKRRSEASILQLAQLKNKKTCEYLYGNSGSDNLIGKSGTNTIYGYAGNDHLEGLKRQSLKPNEVWQNGCKNNHGLFLANSEHFAKQNLRTGDIDLLVAGDGEDEAFGGNGDDQIFGGAVADYKNFIVNNSFENILYLPQIADYENLKDPNVMDLTNQGRSKITKY